MTGPLRDRLIIAVIILFAAAMFATGIGWGLPSRAANPFLFGTRQPWTGRQIQALTESAGEQWDDPSRGADVAGGAVAGPGSAQNARSVWVNDTDARRAQIVRRYRLFTYQPDEMITLMSLARMHPGRCDFDPRLYQYGGLWIYPIGGLLKAASVAHLVDLRGGPEAVAFYLDHPEAFGRFYIVARLYAAAWGLVGVWAVYRIGRLISGRTGPAALAAVLFCLIPVVVNMAHEAKPHLPGAVLALLAILAAARYARTGLTSDALAAGGVCGAAFGMVLSTLPIFSILPFMTLFRPSTWLRRLTIAIAATAIGGAVYAVTNPYVILHQFWQRDVFKSNVQNSTAMYQVGRPVAGLMNEARLIGDGMTAPLALAGFAGAIGLGIRALLLRNDSSEREAVRRATGLLLALPAILIACQFALIGAGKPGEFGRFLLLPDVFLMIEGAVALTAGWTLLHRPFGALSQTPGTNISDLVDREAQGPHKSHEIPRHPERREGSLLPATPETLRADKDASGQSVVGVAGTSQVPRTDRGTGRRNFRPRVIVRSTAISLSLLSAGWGGWVYLRGFIADSQPITPRLRDAQLLQFMSVVGDERRMAVTADPAPYGLPPVDLFQWTIWKLPAEAGAPSESAGVHPGLAADVFVRPVDHSPDQPMLLSTPISWAAKPFEIRITPK